MMILLKSSKDKMALGLKFDDDFVFSLPQFKNFDKMKQENDFIHLVSTKLKQELESKVQIVRL